MSFALDLKKKSLSANMELLKKKEAEQRKAKLLAEKIREQKLHAAEERKRSDSEQRVLIELLSSAWLSAWNGEKVFQYQPSTHVEISVAKSYLKYQTPTAGMTKLQEAVQKLEIHIKSFENRLNSLKQFYSRGAHDLPFVIDDCINLYDTNQLIFNDRWRKDFKEKTLTFERYAYDSKVAKEKNKVVTLKNLQLEMRKDSDLLQIKNLANELKPRIHHFQRRYSELISSPRTVSLVLHDLRQSNSLDFGQLIATRSYQLKVARFVLEEMNVWCDVSSPDAIGKYMSAFRIAAGDDLFDAISEHVTDRTLTEKFSLYKQLSVLSSSGLQAETVRREEEKLLSLLNSLYASASKLGTLLSGIDLSFVKVVNGQVIRSPSQKLEALRHFKNFTTFNKFVDEIKWLCSLSGQRFRKAFERHLQSVAAQGKFVSKVKIFEVDGDLLIETPDGNELKCPICWEHFERLLGLLGLEIADATSTGLVKLKWE